ncbi:MAG: hypothetical protein AB2651_22190, partial [Candidatus Thiodiazotropha sp.]
MNITTIGIDLAKSTFGLYGIGDKGKACLNNTNECPLFLLRYIFLASFLSTFHNVLNSSRYNAQAQGFAAAVGVLWRLAKTSTAEASYLRPIV